MGSFLIQGRHGRKGNFEAVIPSSHGGGLVHLWRNNDAGGVWSGPGCFGGAARYVGASLIQGNYGSPGNLEVVATDQAGNLDFFWRLDRAPWTWSGPFRIASGLVGTPSLIQSRHGTKGNFEVVVPHRDGGLAHLWRNNDAGMTWSAPGRFGGTARYVGASLIQGNYGSPGNLEVVATDQTGNLDFFWRLDRAPWTWSGPFRIASGLAGAPSLIQGRHGTKGNFEVVVPHRDGGLAHLWRNNDAGMTWSAPGRFVGGPRYTGVALIQGNYGSPGNLELLARDEAGNVDFFWRMDRAPWTWTGPWRVGGEISRSVSECVYSWTSAYHQGDTHVTVRIQLVPEGGVTAAQIASLQPTWRNGIISKWANRFDCRAGNGDRKAITFDVHWVASGAHHVVRVRPGPAQSNMTNWDTSDSGDVASHEFGHMLGHPDEYASTACPSRSPVNTGTVMDDNTETVQRLYNRIAAFHCGHGPASSGPGEPPEAGEARTDRETRMPDLRSLDALEPARRAEALERLRAAGEARDDDRGRTGGGPGGGAGAGATEEISFDITGGAPSERYLFHLAVTAEGGAEKRVVDELGGADRVETVSTVPSDVATRVFAAAAEAGLLADEPPAEPALRTQGDIVPDSMIAVVTLRSGDAVRRVVVPAANPDQAARELPGEPADVPVGTDFQLSRESAAALAPLLGALAAVEAELS
ncbi:hypothetical protein KZX45_13620 [Georgenia sp. EYE_87]|uniref:hypothetical protein n=1 Tax=Georgenia sp. EYE_87 TaxID=2853448 RepID=UPI002005D680|nr:hypothetical protein [Georgenia sp. EYE_87]MCK6211584.1 hypothetical protein [Georgenia sp. EYE_87]